ncbi:putative glycolipid-binding domain-containing protein [Actinotalea solisilvae]|uniref:putative glycolipid-binding domain-containing protein n=1 Tax=Actinotalea solisilvae TaxID=2072922 RepID=UPI0018F13FF6|nr:putative glycolipid-binding domain-containing protein [Actinotalea solisilvae]
MSTRERLVAWRGVDPDRVDAARVVLHDDRLSAWGTSCAGDHTTAYRLVTGAGWVTRELDVTCRDAAGERRLELRRADDGRWSARRWSRGQETPVTLPDLDGALDCDLALCPLTNTMPLLRLRAAGTEATGALVMAWVAVPGLEVLASEQRYGPSTPTPDGGAAVRFATDGFAATIVVDADGLVVDYPGIGRRLTG